MKTNDSIEADNLKSLTPTPECLARIEATRRKWEAKADASARKESPAVREMGRIIARLVDRHEG